MTQNNKQKGRELEKYVADKIREFGASGAGSREKADIVTYLNTLLELIANQGDGRTLQIPNNLKWKIKNYENTDCKYEEIR